MNEWHIYKGEGKPHEEIKTRLPEAPRWRQFKARFDEDAQSDKDKDGKGISWDEQRGMTFKPDDDEIQMVNAALYLRRPLLITGKPGSGKSSLAYSIAYELKLGTVLYWPITTRSTLKEGLYRYDAIGRLQELQILRYEKPQGIIKTPDIGLYVRLGPLGTAFLPSKKPRILLIDEIDKSDIDLPNDLLNIFEEGQFEIPELSRLSEKEVKVFPYDSQERVSIIRGRVVCDEFPVVVLTSNEERELPAPFLRRCLRLDIKEPSPSKLHEIVKAHFKDSNVDLNECNKLINTFIEMRKKGTLATDQLLNAIYLVTKGIEMSENTKDIESLRKAIFKHLSSMATT
jgi:MoxR-like ATPase